MNRHLSRRPGPSHGAVKPFRQLRMLRMAAGTAAIACALMLSACGSANGDESTGGAGREVITKPDKKITVIDATPAKVDEQMEVSGIDELEGVIGMDWLSDERIIIGKDNTDMEPIAVEGEKQYPRNLFIRDLSAEGQADEALHPEQANQTFALLSADKSHLFYKKNSEETAHGYIMDMATRVPVPTGKETMRASNGAWVDNERVIFPLFKGTIATSDLDGNTETVLETKDYMTANVSQRGSRIYYTLENNDLMAYDTDTKQQTKLDKNIAAIEPSPDGKQLAVVRVISETERELTLTDAELNKKFTLATESDIFGISWSTGGSKLAYSVNSGENGVNGVFVADAATGKTTQISVDTQYGTMSMRWSPSGDKLMTSTVVMKNEAVVMMTYIISF